MTVHDGCIDGNVYFATNKTNLAHSLILFVSLPLTIIKSLS